MNTWRHDFPIFQRHPDVVYLDTAATAQKPHVVIEAEQRFYQERYASVHRAIYQLAEEATKQYEAARATCAAFIHARSPSEIIFTHNATHALNLAAWIEAKNLTAGDEILLSTAEHHSNFLPWQRLSGSGPKLVMAGLTDITKNITAKTKVVAVTQASNVLGEIADIAAVTKAAHEVGAHVVVDAAQSAAHLPIDVQAPDIDYLAVSGHKLYGPMGTGFLYAKAELLADAEPFLVGGGMVSEVNERQARPLSAPHRFEAGTPNVAGAIGLAAAIEYLQQIGWEAIQRHEQELTAYALEKLRAVKGLKLYSAGHGLGIFSFTIEAHGRTLHSHDVAQILDGQGVAIRGGHHCAQPLMAALGVTELNRASLGLYSTTEDIDRLSEALESVRAFLTPGVKVTVFNT